MKFIYSDTWELAKDAKKDMNFGPIITLPDKAGTTPVFK
jgi:hypothetical protein